MVVEEEVKVGIEMRGARTKETIFKLKKDGRSEMKVKAMGIQKREIEILGKDKSLIEWIGGGITKEEDKA